MFSREQMIDTLASVYIISYPAAAAVAKICDEKLDRSGRLLGEVRIAAKELCKN